MVDLRFERIAQVVAIAALGSKDDGISRYFVKAGEIRIKFSSYIKSQVHLNVVYGLFGRGLQEYVEALHFLDGHLMYAESATKVLRYFYSDLSNFLISNTENVDLYVEVDTENFDFPKEVYVLEELKRQFEEGFFRVRDGSMRIEDWEYSEMLDCAKDADDLCCKSGSYAFALVLRRQCQCADLKIIESR